MRGRFRDQGDCFPTYRPIAGGAGAGEAPLAADPGAGASGFDGTRPRLRKALCERGASIDPSGAIAERFAFCKCSTASARNGS